MTLNPQKVSRISATNAERNVALYPWFKTLQSLTFSQAIWFYYFQEVLSPADAILLYALCDLVTTALEVPSGYVSDRFGRRPTLIFAVICSCAGALTLGLGDNFGVFVVAQILIGSAAAFTSGTDNAFLYESLVASNRQHEIEAQELKAWRYSFVALAVSAAIGGAIAMYSLSVTFIFSGIALGLAVVIAFLFYAPPESPEKSIDLGEVPQIGPLRSAMSNPVLLWLFVLSVLMYTFSHVPYVFGQPFIFSALSQIGLGDEAPITSGLVTTVMMIISVITSLYALRLRFLVGLPATLLLAFGLQIALSGVLAATSAPIVIAILLLRMVPDALSKPFIIARIQPLLRDGARATYLSLQSLAGRVLFAMTLYVAAGSAKNASQLEYPQLQLILGVYVLFGLFALVALAVAARKLRIEGAPVDSAVR